MEHKPLIPPPGKSGKHAVPRQSPLASGSEAEPRWGLPIVGGGFRLTYPTKEKELLHNSAQLHPSRQSIEVVAVAIVNMDFKVVDSHTDDHIVDAQSLEEIAYHHGAGKDDAKAIAEMLMSEADKDGPPDGKVTSKEWRDFQTRIKSMYGYGGVKDAVKVMLQQKRKRSLAAASHTP